MGRPAVLVAVGTVVVLASLSFSSWALVSYPVSATPVDSTAEEPPGHVITDFGELDSDSQSLVASAAEQDSAVVVYARPRWLQVESILERMLFSRTTLNEESNLTEQLLPGIVADEEHWFNRHHHRAYVQYDGTTHEVTADIQAPDFGNGLGGGLLAGTALIVVGGVAGVRDWDDQTIYLHAGTWGSLALCWLGWYGNVHGYIWALF